MDTTLHVRRTTAVRCIYIIIILSLKAVKNDCFQKYNFKRNEISRKRFYHDLCSFWQRTLLFKIIMSHFHLKKNVWLKRWNFPRVRDFSTSGCINIYKIVNTYLPNATVIGRGEDSSTTTLANIFAWFSDPISNNIHRHKLYIHFQPSLLRQCKCTCSECIRFELACMRKALTMRGKLPRNPFCSTFPSFPFERHYARFILSTYCTCGRTRMPRKT